MADSTKGALTGPSMNFTESIPKTASLSAAYVAAVPNASKLKGKLKAPPLTHRFFQGVPGVDMIREGRVDPKWIAFVTDVETKVLAMRQHDVETDGLYIHTDSVNEDVSFLRSAPVHPMLPMGHPPVREYNTADHGYSSAELSVWQDMCDQFWGSISPVDYLHTSPGTTSGPYWLSTPQDKAVLAFDKIPFWLNDPAMQKAVIDGDYAHLARNGMYFASYLQRRMSPERPGKERFVHTGKTLIEGLDPIVANKSLQSDIDLSLVKSSTISAGRTDFATFRARPVHAVNSSVNWPYMYPLNLHLKGWLYRHAETYRVVRRTDIDRRLKRHPFAVAIDFSEFDTKMEAVLIEMFFNAAEKVAPAHIIAGLRRSFFCGLYSPAINLDGSDAAWLGSPFAITEHYLGLPSGHCMNLPLGRLKGGFSMIVMMAQAGHLHLSDWERYLDGELADISAANSTDDCLFFFSTKKMQQDFRALVEAKAFKRVGNIGLEDATMYLGMVIVMPDGPGRTPYAKRRPTGLLRALTPERSNDPLRRPNSPWGWVARRAEYAGFGSTPSESTQAAQTMWEHMEASFYDVYGHGLSSQIDSQANGLSELLGVDAKLIDDPSRLDWDPAFIDLLDERPELESLFNTLRVPYDHVVSMNPYLEKLQIVNKTEATL